MLYENVVPHYEIMSYMLKKILMNICAASLNPQLKDAFIITYCCKSKEMNTSLILVENSKEILLMKKLTLLESKLSNRNIII